MSNNNSEFEINNKNEKILNLRNNNNNKNIIYDSKVVQSWCNCENICY